MFHHISIGVTDVVRAARFYDEVFESLGFKRVMNFLPQAVAYGQTFPHFWVQLPRDGTASSGNGAHVAFGAKDKAAVNAFHARALQMGGKDNGAPGPRPNYGPDYYGAFIIDPDGNHIEAVVMPKAAGAKKAPAKKAKAAASKKTKAPAKKVTAKAKPAGRKSATRRAAPRARARGRRR